MREYNEEIQSFKKCQKALNIKKQGTCYLKKIKIHWIFSNLSHVHFFVLNANLFQIRFYNNPLVVTKDKQKKIRKKTNKIFFKFQTAQETILYVKNRKTWIWSDSWIICVKITFSQWKMMQEWISVINPLPWSCSFKPKTCQFLGKIISKQAQFWVLLHQFRKPHIRKHLFRTHHSRNA